MCVLDYKKTKIILLTFAHHSSDNVYYSHLNRCSKIMVRI